MMRQTNLTSIATNNSLVKASVMKDELSKLEQKNDANSFFSEFTFN